MECASGSPKPGKRVTFTITETEITTEWTAPGNLHMCLAFLSMLHSILNPLLSLGDDVFSTTFEVISAAGPNDNYRIAKLTALQEGVELSDLESPKPQTPAPNTSPKDQPQAPAPNSASIASALMPMLFVAVALVMQMA